MVQNLAQAKDVMLPVETIDFNSTRAENALQDKLIMECTEDEIRPKLALIFSMVGLRPQHFPSGQEKQDLHDYLRMKFGKKTLSELVLAFDLAINNELDIKPDDVKIYDQFTIAYLALVMGAYKKWLYNQWLYKQSKSEKPKPGIEEKKTLTNEEWEEWLVDIRGYEFNKIPALCYDYLVMSGKINPSTKEKHEAIDKAMPIYSASIQEDIRLWNEFLTQKANGCILGNHYASLITISKRLIAQEYLKNN